jgi:galactokinase
VEAVTQAVAAAVARAQLPSVRFLDFRPADSGTVVCRDCVELAGMGCS